MMSSVKFEAPKGKPYRVSSDSVWPLRGADGMTFAERKRAAAQDSAA